MSFWQKAIWSDPDQTLQHVCCGQCWIFTLQIFGCLQARKHFRRCTSCIFFLTVQAQSVSLTFTHVNRERYGGRKQFHCLRITSKDTSAKSQDVPVLLGGKPRGRQTGDGRQGQTDRFLHWPTETDKWTDRKHQSDGILGEGRGQDLWVNYVTLRSYREHWERDLPGHRDLGDRK